MSCRIISRRIERVRDGLHASTEDTLAVEEPLEIVLDGQPYSVTMRLPGDDKNLALGFLFTEGVIGGAAEVAAMRHCTGALGDNRLHVDLHPGTCNRPPAQPRVSVSSCGVCGSGSLERLRANILPVPGSLRLRPEDLFAMRRRAERRQAVFSNTGATHFAALFDAGCNLLAFAEDLGRHNALDKVIGRILASGGQSDAVTALVSSRLSFEMVQKAGMLGVQVLAGMSVATSLAADLAQSLSLTLVGSLRQTRFNLYTSPERLSSPGELLKDTAEGIVNVPRQHSWDKLG